MVPQRIPPELLAITPPTRGDLGAGRVGPELAPVRGERAVRVAEDRPRPDPGRGAVLEHLDPAPAAADIDQNPIGLRLPVEARPAGAEDERDAAGGERRT